MSPLILCFPENSWGDTLDVFGLASEHAQQNRHFHVVVPVNGRGQTVLENLGQVRLFAQVPDFLFVVVRQVLIKNLVASPHRVGLDQHVENREPVFYIHQEIEPVHVNSDHLNLIPRLAGVYIVPQKSNFD